MASRWHVGGDPERPADQGPAQGRPAQKPQRRHHRQPNREDDRDGRPRGYDAGKRIKGRKRHILVDTLGLLLASWSTPQAFRTLPARSSCLAKIVGRFPRLRLIWTDGAYQPVVGWAKSFGGWTLELVRKPKELRTFQVLPYRWKVERTLGWLNRSRRLSKDYEHDTGSSEAMVHLAMIHLMLKRLCPV